MLLRDPGGDNGVGGWVGEVMGINTAGTIAVGMQAGPNLKDAWKWTPAAGVTSLGRYPAQVCYFDWWSGAEICEDRETVAFSVSDDGKVITGSSRLTYLGVDDGAIYTPKMGWMLLADFLQKQGVLEASRWQSLGARVSADGKTLTGTGTPLAADYWHGFRLELDQVYVCHGKGEPPTHCASDSRMRWTSTCRMAMPSDCAPETPRSESQGHVAVTTATLPLVQIAFSVVDLRLTERWFREGFGFAPAGGSRCMMSGPLAARVQGLPRAASTCWWLVGRNPWFQLELFQFERPVARPLPLDYRPCDIGYSRIGLWVADFDATLARLDGLGTRPVAPAIGANGRRRVFVRSPDGVYVEIMEHDPIGADATRDRTACPVAVRSVTLSVPDLARSVAFFRRPGTGDVVRNAG